MAKLIVTTVGTSIISNGIYDQASHANGITEISNGRKPRNYDDIVEKTTVNLRNAVNEGLRGKNISAEIASLMSFKNAHGYGLSTEDRITLLATDTNDGLFCAEVNKNALEALQWCAVVGPITVKGFNTTNAKEFKTTGWNNFKTIIDKQLAMNGWTARYINITGGYKGIIPFATKYAFDKGMALIYLYEEERSDLMIIGQEQQNAQTNPGRLSVTVICDPLGG